MSHLAPDLLYAAVFDDSPLPAEAAAHLAQCAACQRAQAKLAVLAQELVVSRAAAPKAATIDRYASLFTHVQQSPSRLGALWRSAVALLTWDSRRQLAPQGVRSAVTAGYRLLYANDQFEVELLVESDGHLFRVQGEIVGADDGPLTPALVQWLSPAGELLYETQSAADGQFTLRGVQPGLYRLAVLMAPGSTLDRGSIEIEALEIA